MKLMRPVEVVPGVYQLTAIGAKVTVLLDDDGVVLVDAGVRGSLRLIAAGLRALDSSWEQVRLVVLTHYHPDHSGGLGELVGATSARVAVHRQEAGIINGEKPVPSPFRNPILAGVTQPFLPLLYGQPVKVDYLLEDGDRLPTMTEEVQTIHTPGHTRGSICLYLASKRVLIVGDVLQYRFRRLSLPAAAVTQDPEQARESLKKLVSLDFDVICFSHFPPLRQHAREALQRLIQKTEATSDKW